MVFTARTESDVQANAERAKAFGVQALAVPCDVRDDGQLQTLVTRTVEAFGRIDIVVNNAGGHAESDSQNQSQAVQRGL